MLGAILITLAHISLPLMGIRNPNKQRYSAVQGAELITPHGDQELRGGTHEGADSTNLITPHGDQEPLCICQSRAEARNSLPLMGIRNPTARCKKNPQKELITPHGDQEPC